VNNPLPFTAWTPVIWAAYCNFTFCPLNQGTTCRTLAGHHKSRFGPSALFRQYPDNFRNYIPGFMNNHMIPDPDVLFPYNILIVNSRTAHSGTCNLHRLQRSGRCQHPGPPNPHMNTTYHCFSLFGRKLIGNSPSGAFAGGSQFNLLLQIIDLNYHAIYFIRQLVPPFSPCLTVLNYFINIWKGFNIGIDL